MFVTDKRIQKRCPKEDCKSVFISFELNPLPQGNLIYVCDTCGHRFKAQREEDHGEFKKQAVVFNQ